MLTSWSLGFCLWDLFAASSIPLSFVCALFLTCTCKLNTYITVSRYLSQSVQINLKNNFNWTWNSKDSEIYHKHHSQDMVNTNLSITYVITNSISCFFIPHICSGTSIYRLAFRCNVSRALCCYRHHLISGVQFNSHTRINIIGNLRRRLGAQTISAILLCCQLLTEWTWRF